MFYLGLIKSFAIFLDEFGCDVYIIRPEQFRSWDIDVAVDNIILANTLTYFTLIDFECDLKASQKNVQFGQIRELIFHEF